MTHYLFDIDGTLTKPRQSMSRDFCNKFLSCIKDKSIFLVAGSDIGKVREQVNSDVINICSGIFCSMGNELWFTDGTSDGMYCEYRKDWVCDNRLLNVLTSIRELSPYPIKRGNWLEPRTGMVNFSIPGRDSNIDERIAYSEWDKQNKERESTVKKLHQQFHNLDFRIGGQISIDISPNGNNKSLASKWIRHNIGGKLYFFGDSCFDGGNDVDIYEDIVAVGDGKAYNVDTPEVTLQLLQELCESNKTLN